MQTTFKTVTRIFGILALIALPLPALAQQTAAPAANPRHEGLGIGVKGGFLTSSLSVKDLDGLSSRTGVIGGLFLGGNRPGIVGVGVDILYARKGARHEGFDATVRMDYIEVPVYMRINAGSSSLSGASVYGTVGVDLNFLLKSTFNNVADTKDYQRADYGLALGLGVEITRFIVEGRYTKGLGNIAKNKNEDDIKTKSFAVMVGFRFN